MGSPTSSPEEGPSRGPTSSLTDRAGARGRANPLSPLLFGVAIAIVLDLGLFSGATDWGFEGRRGVIIAARDLKEEEPMTPDMVRVVPMALSVVPAGSFEQFEQLEGRWIKRSVPRGHAVLARSLGPRGKAPGPAVMFRRGMRAYAIEVDEAPGGRGLFSPGQHVGVVSPHAGSADAGEDRTMLVPDAMVVASGVVTIGTGPESRRRRMVTLAVTDQQAAILAVARKQRGLSVVPGGSQAAGTADASDRSEPGPQPSPGQRTRHAR